MEAARRCQFYIAKSCCPAGTLGPARTRRDGASGFIFSGYNVRGCFLPFFLNKFKLSRKKKINSVETLALPHKEPSINKKIHIIGKKPCPLLFHLLLSHGFCAAGGWRGARGISAFLWDQSLEAALSLEQRAQPGPLQRSRVYFCPGLERGWRRSGGSARGALGIARPAAV